MDKDLKFAIITEGQRHGVTLTCKKHNISRTLYYRWLKRYKSFGISGLDNTQKNFTPVNKTKAEIELTILRLVKRHPDYGPRQIKYLLEEIGHNISESAVYNVMKRSNLTTRFKRIRFSNKRGKRDNNNYPDFNELKSGECWLFWTTYYGFFEGIGDIYEYTIFDYVSRIACSRLYSNLSIENLENILTAVAIPVAQNLSIEVKHLCFFQDSKIIHKKTDYCISYIDGIFKNSGFDISVHVLKEQDKLSNAPLEIFNRLRGLREGYTDGCLSYLMAFTHSAATFKELKTHLQKYIRDYNINYMSDYGGRLYSPVGYHVKQTNSEMVLPLWAYIEREY
ncbi:helix-turn-helix domain containing protein [Alkaliphilus pronyensis]|uniref:Helix-turn-helix domain containing protein n=1 Tax=Alkaliphilus pronyensis TaxID=1482732 RepID=A0A6I0F1V0_9FIRM|nr:helix-turn-helix domain-containing protein [Alkaliphilus pronyensis]KAB3530761.1 helix-turn-helix domain containing protein [Alkaliphilus pronyensis]